MANEDTTNTQTETTAANTVVVPVPEPGQALTVTVDAEQIPQLSFDPGTESTQEFVGSDLVFTLDNGAVLTFEDFAVSINDGEVSSIMLADGSIIPIDALIAAWSLEVPETAAGEATASGGASAYGDDMGDALSGIDKLGTQNPDPFGATSLAPVEDEQTPVLAPENLPPVATAATATITVTPVNDPPETYNDSASGIEDAASITVSLTGSDIDGTVASFSLDGLPNDGTLYTDAALTTEAAIDTDYAATGNALDLYFVPDADWSGEATFDYAATDNDGLADATAATATITVTPGNDDPLADPDKTVWIPDANDSAFEVGQELIGYSLDVSAPTDIDSAVTVKITSLPDAEVGTLTYFDTDTQDWVTLNPNNDVNKELDTNELESLHFKATNDDKGTGHADISGLDNTFTYVILEDGVESSVGQVVTLETVVPDQLILSEIAVDVTNPLTSGNPYEVNFAFSDAEAVAFGSVTDFTVTLYTDHDNPQGSDSKPNEMQAILYIDTDGNATFMSGGDFGKDPTGVSNGFEARFMLTDFANALWTDSGLRTGGNTGELLDPNDPGFADGNIVWSLEVPGGSAYQINPDGSISDTSMTNYLDTYGGIDAGESWQVIYNDDEAGNAQGRFARVDIEATDPLIATSMTVHGEGEIDLIYGSDDNDFLHGGDGDDIIFGGIGGDTIAGEIGNDILVGGEGEDTFIFSANAGEGNDTISDFNSSEDTLSFTDLLDPEGDGLADDLSAYADTIKVAVVGEDLVLTVPDQGGGPAETTVTLAGLGNEYVDYNGVTLDEMIDATVVSVDTYAS